MNLLLLQLWNLTAGMMGNKILNSQFGQGIKALLGDSIEAGQWVGGTVVVIMFIVASFKKGQESEEQGRKRYTNWQIALGVIFVLILMAKEVFNLVGTYFGISLAS